MFEDKEEKAREEIIDYALKLSRAGDRKSTRLNSSHL